MSPTNEQDSLLSRPDDRPPDAEEILRRLRDQLIDAHRKRILRLVSDRPDDRPTVL